MSQASAPAGRHPALEVRHASKVYRDQGSVTALDDVSLRVESGEMVAVVGPSGSGKSTLLHIMGTLDRPSQGTVLIDGVDTTDLSDTRLAGLRAARIGFVFQHFHLLSGTSAINNVAAGLMYLGISPPERRVAAQLALERVGLGGRLDHEPAAMSGGERQRVAIARALVAQPAVVLADEPTGNLDSQSSVVVMDLFDDLNREGTTFVVITHDHTVADRMPKRVELLDGRVVREAKRAAVAPRGSNRP